MDKLTKVRAEIERRKKLHEDSLINPIHIGFGLQNVTKAKIGELTYLLSFIDSMQKEPVSVWHDASKETPAQGSNILMIRKEEKDTNYPPIAGCFHGTNSRLDGRNWGYYNGFCYNEIEPPLKWAYVDDLLNLSNFERIVKDWKEELVSEKKCMFTKDNYTNEDRKVLCDGCEEECKFNKKEEPVSEDLEEAIGEYCSNPDNFISYVDTGFAYRSEQKDDIPLIIKAIKFGAQWKEQQLMAKAVKVNISNASIVSLPSDCNLKVGDKVLIIKEN